MDPPQFGMTQGQDGDKGGPGCGKIIREKSVGGAGISRHQNPKTIDILAD